jgi:hypothetical protein
VCHQLGHFSSQCLNKKKGKGKGKMAATADMDAFATKFEDEFSLIACMTSSLVTGTWYIDSGASCHMTGVCEYFSRLEEFTSEIFITLGDDAKYKASGYENSQVPEGVR